MKRYIESIAIILGKLCFGMMLGVLVFSASSETLIKLIAVGFASNMVIDAYAGGRLLYEKITQDANEARQRTRGLSDSRLRTGRAGRSPL